MSFRRPLLLVAIAAAFAAATCKTMAEGTSDATVIELFTSQGCSSCPKADALLATYADRANVVALSMNVDYWDYLGWRDTLASPVFTARWREYAATRGDGQVYTPQAVINGITHVIGSKSKRIDDAAAATGKALEGRRPTVVIEKDGGHLNVRIGDAITKPTRAATVWLAAVRSRVTVPIKRGENSGATITYVNVVRSLESVGTWTGAPTTVRLEPSTFGADDTDRSVLLVQEGRTGAILAAAWVR